MASFLDPNSVDLTVCSPPYGNAIDYKTHSKGNGKERYRGNEIWKDRDDYFADIVKVFEQVRQVTKIGGYLCIVIGYEVIQAEIIPLPSLLIAKMIEQQKSINLEERWVLREEIIWNKVTAGRNGNGNRFGSTILNPYPTYYHANVMHEYIFVLSKGYPKISREEARKPMYKFNMDDQMKREIANSTWHIPEDEGTPFDMPATTWTIAPVPPRSVNHPAAFPEQIAFRLITLFSKTDDTVLDPFNGSGTTTKVARNMHRHYIGVDIIEEYCKIARKRVSEPLKTTTKLFVKQWGSQKTNLQETNLDEYGR
ncbi:MAG: DNA-methyltransferase [Nitrosopumilaceae archaeon]